MQSDAIAERVINALRESSGYTGKIERELILEDLGLDSLSFVDVMISLEETADIYVAAEELTSVATVGDLIDVADAAKNREHN